MLIKGKSIKANRTSFDNRINRIDLRSIRPIEAQIFVEKELNSIEFGRYLIKFN